MVTTVISAILNPMVGWISTYVIDPIASEFRVWRNFRENIEELENTRLKLEARKSDKAREVEEEMNQEGVEKSAEADLWFTQVDDALSNANNLRNEYPPQSQISATSCPNCFCRSRYQVSKRALKLKQDVLDKLLAEEPRSGWTVALPRQIGRNMNTVSIEGQTTTKKLKGEIIDAVLDDRYVVVGLHGMGGIGKTTLLRHANEHFRMTQHFESVIFITVSSTPNFKEIRKQIAGCFRLRNRQDDNDLKEQLSHLFETRKYLLILDDLWEPIIDLGEICNIPVPKKESGCKILMSSRFKAVITRFVTRFEAKDSLRSIQVNRLQPGEAWNLFVRKVGEDIISKPSIAILAKDVLKKCGGLPLAIVVIGGTMSTRETEGEWKDALRELKQPTSNLEGMKELFSILMFSFEKLEPIEQSLFLFCCLFPEDYNIQKGDLFDFAIGEETLIGMHQLEDLRNKINVLVRKLLNSSMLEEGDYFGWVKTHDVMRELGLWITSPTTTNKYHSKFIVKDGPGITQASNALEWRKATKISLINNYRIESLPQLPDQCPQLHTLLLVDCSSIKDVPQVHFLEHMPAIQILHLSCCYEVKKLPPSISHLVNLRLLNLMWCENLQDLPSQIGMLLQLISLNLCGCKSLRNLPVEMKKLNNLRRLDIAYTKNLKRIPCGVLSGLHKLEELDTTESGLKWYTSGIEELSQLINLIDIGIELRKANIIQWFKPLLKSKRIGRLHLWNCTIDPSIWPYLLDIDGAVRFKSCEGLTHLPTLGCKWLAVHACPELKKVLIVEEAERNAFESLESLGLFRLDQLETICTGVPQPACFSNMTQMKIHECLSLKVIFTNGVTRLLKNLRLLQVFQCPQLVKTVADEDLEINALPRLHTMYLWELPELTDICHLDLNWSSLSKVRVRLCSKLRRPAFRAQRADILLIDEMDSQMTRDYLYSKQKNTEREKEEEKKDAENDDDDGGDDDDNDDVLVIKVQYEITKSALDSCGIGRPKLAQNSPCLDEPRPGLGKEKREDSLYRIVVRTTLIGEKLSKKEEAAAIVVGSLAPVAFVVVLWLPED